MLDGTTTTVAQELRYSLKKSRFGGISGVKIRYASPAGTTPTTFRFNRAYREAVQDSHLFHSAAEVQV